MEHFTTDFYSCIHEQLGAFLAGALLAETNYRTQIEAEIRPFRGLLLGLFFVTTGTSIDIEV
jgi:Kef-type K+ transport system membrane component KefB